MAISNYTHLPPSSGLTGDIGEMARLRNSAASDPRAAIREASRQFETIFMQEMLKGMRKGNEALSSGMLDNAGSKLGTEMLDGQFAKQMTGQPGGLAAVIERQLSRQIGAAMDTQNAPAGELTDASELGAFGLMGGDLPTQAAPSVARQEAETVNRVMSKFDQASAANLKPISLEGRERQVEFLKRHEDAARAAEESSGIPASFMMAQAAHESGWGRREIKNPDGSSSHNVFGIKAGPGWTGATTEVVTTEVIGGQARKVKAKFRAYSSYEDSFKDYARMMKNNPRYAQVVEQSASAEGFAKGLQRAGYATDPQYGDKMAKMINMTLRLQRAMG